MSLLDSSALRLSCSAPSKIGFKQHVLSRFYFCNVLFVRFWPFLLVLDQLQICRIYSESAVNRGIVSRKKIPGNLSGPITV